MVESKREEAMEREGGGNTGVSPSGAVGGLSRARTGAQRPP